MTLTNAGVCTVILWFTVLISSYRSDKFVEETVPRKGCICPPPTAGDNSVRTLCGHEIGGNCSRHVQYWCEGRNISVRVDCPYFTAVTRPDLKTAHYCHISAYNRLARHCAFISDCTEDLGLCGFPSLQAVKDEIRKLPTEVDRRVHCNRLHYPQNCKVISTYIPMTEIN
jgi:hypothetical protein